MTLLKITAESMQKWQAHVIAWLKPCCRSFDVTLLVPRELPPKQDIIFTRKAKWHQRPRWQLLLLLCKEVHVLYVQTHEETQEEKGANGSSERPFSSGWRLKAGVFYNADKARCQRRLGPSGSSTGPDQLLLRLKCAWRCADQHVLVNNRS